MGNHLGAFGCFVDAGNFYGNIDRGNPRIIRNQAVYQERFINRDVLDTGKILVGEGFGFCVQIRNRQVIANRFSMLLIGQ